MPAAIERGIQVCCKTWEISVRNILNAAAFLGGKSSFSSKP